MASRFEEPFRVLLLIVGVGLCAAGFLYSGGNSSVTTTAIIAGTSLAALGLLEPKLRELRFGLGGFEAKVGEDGTGDHPAVAAAGGAAAPPRPLPPEMVRCDPEALNRFAHLVTGDTQQAREAVEDAIVTVRVKSRRMGEEERAVLTFQTLIPLLDTAAERSFLRGRFAVSRAAADEGDMSHHEIVEALQELAFLPRVTFVLAVQWGLGVVTIAKLLDQPPEGVELDLKQARALMRPHVQARARQIHA